MAVFDGRWWDLYSRAEDDDKALSALRKKKGELSNTQSLALAGLGLKPPFKEVVLPSRPSRVDKQLSWPGILDRGLQRAIDAFEAAARSGVESGPFLVHEYVPYPAFEAWYKTKENVWRLAFQFTEHGGGAVLLYGDPSFLHEYVSNWFGQVISCRITQLTGECASDYIQLLGSTKLIQGAGLHKEPDFCIQPVDSSRRHPPLVGETAYANESLVKLKEELVRATTNGCADIAYGVKVTLKRNEKGGFEDVQLRFLEKRQGCSDFSADIDFSPQKCTAAGLPQFQVRLELKVLFAGVQQHVDKKLMDGVVTFDLFKMQRQVVKLLQNGDVDFAFFPRDRTVESPHKPLLGVKNQKIVKQKKRSRLQKIAGALGKKK